MMFDSVMPDFDLSTVGGKQEFRKWMQGEVRNEIRSYTPEALGISTTIGSDISNVGVIQAAVRVERGGGSPVSPIVFEAIRWGTSNTLMWNANDPTKVLLPYTGYYQVSGYAIGDSSSSGVKDINFVIFGSGNIGNIAFECKNNITANEGFVSNLSGLCYNDSINNTVSFYISNTDATPVQSFAFIAMSVVYLGA